MELLLWIAVSALYLVLLWTLGIRSFRNGHYLLFFGGIVFPVLWIVGTIMGPTTVAGADAARSSLQP